MIRRYLYYRRHHNVCFRL